MFLLMSICEYSNFSELILCKSCLCIGDDHLLWQSAHMEQGNVKQKKVDFHLRRNCLNKGHIKTVQSSSVTME